MLSLRKAIKRHDNNTRRVHKVAVGDRPTAKIEYLLSCNRGKFVPPNWRDQTPRGSRPVRSKAKPQG